MFKRTVKYTDYNGKEQEEVCHFNLTKVELAMIDASYEGGFESAMNAMIAKQDTMGLIRAFADILGKAYGEMSADGKRFVKDKAKTDAFITSEVFSEFVMGILNNPDEAQSIGKQLVSNAK